MTNYSARIISTALLVALSLLPSIALGQAGAANESTCSQAAMIVAKGHPEEKEQWALAALHQCGAAGSQAYANGLTSYRSETDTIALDVFMRGLDQWRDANILSVAVALASDAGATPQARVYAVRHLTRLVNPLFFYRYGELVRGTTITTDASGDMVVMTSGCRTVIGSVRPPYVGVALPADYRTRIRSTLEALASDANAPAQVRNSAKCANFYIQ